MAKSGNYNYYKRSDNYPKTNTETKGGYVKRVHGMNNSNPNRVIENLNNDTYGNAPVNVGGGDAKKCNKK